MNDEVKASLNLIFECPPPFLIQEPPELGGTDSFACPEPGFYDKHLAERFVLKHIKHMPHLGNILKSQVDSQILQADTLPTSTDYLPRRKQDIYSAWEGTSRSAFNERGVERFYENVVFHFCSRVASTLTLHPKSEEWRSLLAFTPQHGSAPIADATIKIQCPPQVHDQTTWDSAQPEVREAIRFIEHSTDWCVATVEHLPLTDGTKQLFEQLLGQARGNASPTMEPVGFGWTFCDVKEKGRTCPSREILVERACDDDPNRFWNKFVNPKNDSENTSQSNPRGSRDRTAKAAAKDADPPFTAPGETTLEHLLQHSWVQAVKQNSTFILISAGHYEIIAIRDRETQTLCVSDLIEPSKYPGYMKLQVGFYIAGIKDSFARLKYEGGKRVDGDCDSGSF